MMITCMMVIFVYYEGYINITNCNLPFFVCICFFQVSAFSFFCVA